MSSGLTYVTVLDNVEGTSPSGSAQYVFGIYEEALQFATWFSKYTVTVWGNYNVAISIFTTSAGQNGYINNANHELIPFD